MTRSSNLDTATVNNKSGSENEYAMKNFKISSFEINECFRVPSVTYCLENHEQKNVMK